MLSSLLGLRLGPWGCTDGIKRWGKVVAHVAVTLSARLGLFWSSFAKLRFGLTFKDVCH